MAALDNDGDTVEIKGSGAKPYVLKNVGGVLSCSCPAWRMFGGAIDRRTCKHLKKVRGEASEAARISHDFGPRGTSGPVAGTIGGTGPTGPVYVSGPTGYSADIPERAAGSQAAVNLAAGKKLRQDEKAKLYGPPLLLAQSLEDHPDLDLAGWWMSEKLDGCRSTWTGTEFVSRQGNVFKAPSWFIADLPSHPLDGELWMGRQMFQKTMSVVRSENAGDRWKDVTYVVFDHPTHSGPFEGRMVYLLELEANAGWKHARVLRQSRAKGRQDVKDFLEKVVGEGGEGVMLRKPGSLYETTRSSTLLKVKKFSDAEAAVVAHTPGKGRHKGRLGALVVRMPNGKEFSVGTGFSDDDRRNPPLVGSIITYTFTELTDGGTGLPKCAAFLRVRPQE